MRRAGPARCLLPWLAFLLPGCWLLRPPVPPAPLYDQVAREGELRAGAARVDITPVEPVWMAGYQPMRRSRGVHDPLHARVLALAQGSFTLLFITLDLIGVQNGDRTRLEAAWTRHGIDSRHVLVLSSHSHSGPDTLGLWGLPPFFSGQDEEYMETLREHLSQAVEEALARLEPAEMAATSVFVAPEGLLCNRRRPGVLDREVAVLQLRDVRGGAPLATLFGLGCHATVLDRENTLLSADFPGFAARHLEAELGGVALFVAGAVGGAVVPDVQERSFASAERVGVRLAGVVQKAVRAAGPFRRTAKLALWHLPIFLRNENRLYGLLLARGLIDRCVHEDDHLQTEVNLWQVGDLIVLSVPGEITPDLSLRLKERLRPHPVLIAGLANDELGYLLPAHDHDSPWFAYERKLSLGPEAGAQVMERLVDLILLHQQPAAPP